MPKKGKKLVFLLLFLGVGEVQWGWIWSRHLYLNNLVTVSLYLCPNRQFTHENLSFSPLDSRAGIYLSLCTGDTENFEVILNYSSLLFINLSYSCSWWLSSNEGDSLQFTSIESAISTSVFSLPIPLHLTLATFSQPYWDFLWSYNIQKKDRVIFLN